MNSSDFGQLLIFHSIAQENSISGAAKKLNIAVPSVSKSLKNLEKKIGVPLFLRSTRRIQLTETGLKLWQETQLPMEQLKQIWQTLDEQYHEPNGTVRITLSQVHFDLIFKPVYAEFCRRYPEIVLEFSINNAKVDLLAENFDLGVRLGHSLSENVVAKRIYPPMRQGLYVSQQYAEQHGIPHSIKELAQHRLISLRFISSGKIEPLFLRVNGENQLIPFDNTLIFNDTSMLIDAVSQGMGIGRIFEPLVPKQGFVPVLAQHWLTFPESYIYYPPMQHKPKKVQLLLDFLAEKQTL
ncbi:LysR family transcriptional regulator [Glaesserella sp.]|uniref:LysR family transcriptional regulator n=1 Tax=Glaesserella sp. TaxID=2094731 RepID=UPI00359F7D43